MAQTDTINEVPIESGEDAGTRAIFQEHHQRHLPDSPVGRDGALRLRNLRRLSHPAWCVKFFQCMFQQWLH